MRSEQTILLVEDDKVDTLTIRRAFKQLGSQNPIHSVTDGEQALAYLSDGTRPHPGLILLDLNMPRMNGLEFLDRVKADPVLRLIPVIILTTSREDGDRAASFEKSVAGYMVKPVEFEQFVEVMRKINDYWLASEIPPN